MSSKIELTWHGGCHDFALRLGELRQLQDTCGAGPEEVLNRLRNGQWRVNDVIEPIRLGLVGSGELSSKEAGPLVINLIEQGFPLVDFKLIALAVLMAALVGVEDDPLADPLADTTPQPTAETAGELNSA